MRISCHASVTVSFRVCLVALLVLVAASASAADANDYTARGLLSDCTISLDQQGGVGLRGFCLGYIVGVVNATSSTAAACIRIPKGVTQMQTQLVVVKWIEDHPERQHEDRVDAVRSAVAEAFPCKQPKEGKR
jgi:hypothetical protein